MNHDDLFNLFVLFVLGSDLIRSELIFFFWLVFFIHDGFQTDLEGTQGSSEGSSYLMQRRYIPHHSCSILILDFHFSFPCCKFGCDARMACAMFYTISDFL